MWALGLAAVIGAVWWWREYLRDLSKQDRSIPRPPPRKWVPPSEEERRRRESGM